MNRIIGVAHGLWCTLIIRLVNRNFTIQFAINKRVPICQTNPCGRSPCFIHCISFHALKVSSCCWTWTGTGGGHCSGTGWKQTWYCVANVSNSTACIHIPQYKGLSESRVPQKIVVDHHFPSKHCHFRGFRIFGQGHNVCMGTSGYAWWTCHLKIIKVEMVNTSVLCNAASTKLRGLLFWVSKSLRYPTTLGIELCMPHCGHGRLCSRIQLRRLHWWNVGRHWRLHRISRSSTLW